MATDVPKSRLREQLELAMEDVAMAMADSMSYQERLKTVRERCATVWKMADLGPVPEWELEVRPKRVAG